MKTIPIEQLDQRLTQALAQQNEQEAIGLTDEAGTVAWVLRVPSTMKDSEPDLVIYTEGPAGRITVTFQVKQILSANAENGVHRPVFGAGRGTLTVVHDDDEHLKDFQEYME